MEAKTEDIYLNEQGSSLDDSSPEESNKSDQISQIIAKEFDRELELKEKEVILANERILQLLRNIDILKYVATYSYFEPETSGQQQTAIHPTVKKLLRNIHDNEKLDGQDSSVIEILDEGVSEISTQSQSIEEKKSTEPSNSEVYRSNQKFIVGNTSKWLPPDTREDGATHKWMVYVREQKETDISSYVSCVRFYLHESYSPNNIVDVTKPPYVISRRGWGEFTIKVRLYFIHSINKPIDIFHQIKLDETLSGKQTLGSETVVAVNLYRVAQNKCYDLDTDSDEDDTSSTIKKSIEIEHDYF